MSFSNYTRTPSGSELESDFSTNLLKTVIQANSWEGGSASWQMKIVGWDGSRFATCYQDLDVNQEDTWELPYGDYDDVIITYWTDTSCSEYATEEVVETGSPAFSIGTVTGGGGTSTPASSTVQYTLDVGSTLMLGGILTLLIAYWMVGLVRHKSRN